MRHPIAVILLALTAACQSQECPSAADVDVVAASATPDSAVEQVRATLETFSRWTAGQGVCVDAVHLTREMPEDGTEGMVNARGAWVQLDDGPAQPELEARTLHQLCHAADQALGLSGDSPYADEEAFAVACEAGPQAAEELAYTVCADGDLGAQALLDDFVGEWPQRIEEGSWPADPVDTEGFADDAVVVPAGEGAALLGWRSDRSGTEPMVRVVEDGETVATIVGPAIDAGTGWQFFGGGGDDPLLLLRDANGSHALRFDLDAGIALYAHVPRTVAFDEAVVADGKLWGVGRVDDVYGAWTVDLDTGDAQPWSTPTLVEQPHASHGRIAVPHGTDVLVYDIAADAWSAWPLPLQLVATQAMPDAAGSLSVRWAHDDAVGLARLAAPMGNVQLDVESCGAEGTAGTWVAGHDDATWTAR